MWLLNTTTLQLKEFVVNPPPYAILSHTWGSEEVTFTNIHNLDEASREEGFAKIKGCCDKATSDGFDWVWIDTCCIDKSSSSELTEAINSMFKWYKASRVCYVFLADVEDITEQDVFDSSTGAESSHSLHSVIAESRWFTRGWTLQELIAPRYLEFYSAGWVFLGTKSSLEDLIQARTGVPLNVLRGISPTVYTVSERMSWASGRKTTREEDIAYCLLGIFGVNMPLLYGEGDRAFSRLQEEILRRSDDMSILCWSANNPINPTLDILYLENGVLSPSPSQFGNMSVRRYDFGENRLLGVESLTGRVFRARSYGSHHYEPLAITNRGISATVLVCKAFENSLLAYTFTDASLPGNRVDRMGHICVVLKPNDVENSSFMGQFSAVRRDMAMPLAYVHAADLPRFFPMRLILSTTIQTINFSGVPTSPTKLDLRIDDRHSLHSIDLQPQTTGAMIDQASNGKAILKLEKVSGWEHFDQAIRHMSRRPFGQAFLQINCNKLQTTTRQSSSNSVEPEPMSSVHIAVAKSSPGLELVVATKLALNDGDRPLRSLRVDDFQTLQYLRLHCGHSIMFKIRARSDYTESCVEGEIGIF